jgi:membrane protease YdiL (CAAX protease family)
MILPMSPEVRAGLVLAALAALYVRMRRDIPRYKDFKALTDTADRQRFFRTWVWNSFLLLGMGSLVGLLAVGRLDALHTLPREFVGVDAQTASYLPAAFLLSLIAAVTSKIFGQSRAGGRCIGPCIGDVKPLLPWNNRERFWAVLLSLDAGVSEELFFRLLVPLLLVIITKQAVFAVVVTCVLFGLGHAYQGWAGIVGATAGALLLTTLYVASRNIWVAAAFHAAIDLNCLLLRPLLAAGGRRVVSAVVPRTVSAVIRRKHWLTRIKAPDAVTKVAIIVLIGALAVYSLLPG